jgi:ABC-type transport system involved in multi-copper enzyme maturation permease subunit
MTLPRQPRHYILRSAYLGLLWVLGVTAWQATVGWERTATLGDTARFGTLLFELLAYVQLILLLFFGALTAASTIAREKDRRTFIILLMTDLRNYEIVLGKLLGSLLQIVLFLAAMIPLLALLLLLGGIAPNQLLQVVVILIGTALASGSLGTLMALWREKTFPTLALTVLTLVLYLCLVEGLGFLPKLAAWAGLGTAINTSTLNSLERSLSPFQALASVFDPFSYTGAMIAPAYGFAILAFAWFVLLNLISIARLRVWNPSGEPIMQRERPEEEDIVEKDRSRAHAAPGALRKVWANPILWREICTRAYGRRPFLVKLGYLLVCCLISYYALQPLWTGGTKAPFFAANGLVPVGVLSLLLVAAQAVTAITSERDTGALDLLLVTDLTPQEFIFGKLWGIAYNVVEYVLFPLGLTVLYGCLWKLAMPPLAHPEQAAWMNIESSTCISLGIILLLTFAVVLAIHVALRVINSQLAIVNTLGTVFFLSVGTLLCIYLIRINERRFESQWFSFIFFLSAGIGGLWWVLSADRPSAALTLASFVCPPAVFYAVTTILIGKPGSVESVDPFMPFMVIVGAFGFTIAAMLVPLLSEFDVALGRTTAMQE